MTHAGCSNAFERRVGVGNVVERKLLALKLPRGGDGSRRRIGFDIECRALMRVLAVTQRRRSHELPIEGVREVAEFLVGIEGAEIVGDRAVVARGVFECFHGKPKARGVGDGVFVRLHFF